MSIIIQEKVFKALGMERSEYAEMALDYSVGSGGAAVPPPVPHRPPQLLHCWPKLCPTILKACLLIRHWSLPHWAEPGDWGWQMSLARWRSENGRT